MRSKSLIQTKTKSRSLNRTASPGLVDYITTKYQRNIPIPIITTAHKLFGRTKPLTKDDPFFKRFTVDKNNVDS